MPENPIAINPEDVDFEAFYQGKPPIEGSDFSFDHTPWDIGEPQPALVELERSGQLHGEVLDVGCGPGDNAVFLAANGYRMTAVDGSRTALDTARQRAAERGVEVEFVCSDATSLTELDEERFDTVLDSALYHCLAEQQQRAYAGALRRVAKPGARLHMFCFADVESPGFPVPVGISQDNLHTNLGPHWNIQDIRLTHYATAMTREYLTQRGNPFEGLGVSMEVDKLRFDDQQRATAPVWHVHAVRR